MEFDYEQRAQLTPMPVIRQSVLLLRAINLHLMALVFTTEKSLKHFTKLARFFWRG